MSVREEFQEAFENKFGTWMHSESEVKEAFAQMQGAIWAAKWAFERAAKQAEELPSCRWISPEDLHQLSAALNTHKEDK